MQKDVIYIDTEDDITAIIGKVKAAERKIVALVPPKRIGAIQSAVNLKLVHRVAEQAGKHLVIISNNAALVALASSTGIPVAKNLQSKPELAEIPALEIDDGEDIIDGDMPDTPPVVKGNDVPVAGLTDALKDGSTSKTGSAGSLGVTALAARGKAKIPDFNKFRKKMVLIVAAAVLLIAGLVWALVFAPRADIVITARTSDVALNTQVKLGDSLTTSLKDGTVKLITKTSKKDVSIPVEATGKKDVGTKATGAAKFTSNDYSALVAGINIPAGTPLKASNGKVYNTDTAVSLGIGANAKTSGITAAESGSIYNGASGAVSGAPASVSASITGATAGGTDKTITVVQQSDIDTVMDQVVTSADTDAAKKALASQLGSGFIVLESSFNTNKDAVKPSPAVDAESPDGKAVLAGSVTFSISAVSRSEMSTFLKAYLEQAIDGKSNQKIYDDGAKTVSFTNVNATEGGFTANVTTNGKVGPKIDEEALKNYAKGKRFGEIQSYTKNINGVENVDVKFSPFWVSAAPGDTKKISVEFKVND